MLTFGPWDLVLLVAVTAQATILAYVHHPKWKAFVWTLPVPFTLASMAVGRPIDATNVMAINALLVFTHGVRLLYNRFPRAIVPIIVMCAAAYCTIGWGLAKLLPASDSAFWLASAGTFAFGLALYLLTPHRVEPGHRSPLPVWIKAPLIALVILTLVAIKGFLLGFMTFFPMVGVVAAYEARKSLWTISRQAPVVMLTTVPLMAACRLTQDKIGLAGGLVVGWVVFGLFLAPLTKRMWAEWAEVEG